MLSGPCSPLKGDLSRLLHFEDPCFKWSLDGEPGGNLVGFEVGQRVADYEIVSLLGVGGMSRVYGVRNVISHRAEAMKVLLR